MKLRRSGGILLHITSLPGDEGIGSMGDGAFAFVDFLRGSGISFWQILPLGPVAAAQCYSPYASTSTFAGNRLFISLRKLARERWFPSDIILRSFDEADTVDFAAIDEYKSHILGKAAEAFFAKADSAAMESYETFCYGNAVWLEDYALFSALAERFGTNEWKNWERGISSRSPGSMDDWSQRLFHEIRFYKFAQYVFFNQWRDLREYCSKAGVSIIGDIPIYVSLDGADAWANPEIFQLDEAGSPAAVAGVPPDYFSATGQRWGNPLYRWLNRDGSLNEITASWWIRRMKHLMRYMDMVRIDHFRGFESYWAIQPEEKTAVRGKWLPGPGKAIFERMTSDLGALPVIAEDLGVITPEVEKLRDDLGFPGMKILQFAFDGNGDNPYLPHNMENPNCVLYTGTHDNNTTNGWFYGPETGDEVRRHVMEYLGADSFSDMHWQILREALRTTARLVIFPMQDLLGYGSEHRMNTPGTINKNWLWKCRSEALSDELASSLRRICGLYGRLARKP
jgi:4-alpha-glucanotransferase